MTSLPQTDGRQQITSDDSAVASTGLRHQETGSSSTSMFSHSSPANLKIIGAEGHSPDSLREEVARGAKFVIYSYNVSLLVISFKRPSNIHFIRPGQNRVVKGLPFTLVSLVCGWWGIPWGIIYTIQSLHQNLSGGLDVTADLLASLAPPPVDAGGGSSVPVPALPPSPRRPAMSGRRMLSIGAVVAAIVFTVYASVCFFQGRQLQVALVSGLPGPYDVVLNGERHHLRRGATEVLRLPEGDLTLQAELPDGVKQEQHYTFATDFFTRPFHPKVAVINPDGAAVVIEETIFYAANASDNEQPGLVFHTGETSYLIPEPDYVFTEFPDSIRLSSATEKVYKTRLTSISQSTPEQTAALLQQRTDYAAAKKYVEVLAQFYPENESYLRLAATLLKPEDGLQFFKKHLDRRPILVEWHRYYQNYTQAYAPQFDLVAQYHAWLQADPANGALLYLSARLDPDDEDAHAIYEKALAASPPCYYACNALGYDAINAGQFDRALAYFAQAEAHGLQSESLRDMRRAALLGARDFEPLLRDAHARSQAAPDEIAALSDEIALHLAAGHPASVAENLKTGFLQRLNRQKADGETKEYADHYLAATIAHGLGHTDDYIRELAQLPAKEGSLALEIVRGNYAAAEKIIAQYPRSSSQAWLLTYLAAVHAGDAAAARHLLDKAAAAMASEGKTHQRLAASLSGTAPLTPADLSRLSIAPNEKRVILAAFGFNQPEHRAEYFQAARQLNLEPGFPQLFLKETLTE